MLGTQFRAMGSSMQVLLDADGAAAAAAVQQSSAWFAVWENLFSRFSDTSELSRLNQAGEARVSRPLWQLVQTACKMAEATEGRVVPTLLPQMEAAGYRESFDWQQFWHHTDDGLPPSAGDWRRIEFDPTRRIIRLNGNRLDLGGVAKGWCAEQLADKLAGWGAVLVDAGGDIATRGSHTWQVAVAHPLQAGQEAGEISLSSGAVATSGSDYRCWQQNGRRMHHLIDPDTGRPSESDIVSVTVCAGDAVSAEAAAKTALLLGSSRIAGYFAAHRPFSACWFTRQGGMFHTDSFPWITS